MDSFAMMVVRNAAESFLHQVTDHSGAMVNLYDELVLTRLAEGLVMSGLVMTMAGTSRPCHGDEYLISHPLDRLPQKALIHCRLVVEAFALVLLMDAITFTAKLSLFFKTKRDHDCGRMYD